MSVYPLKLADEKSGKSYQLWSWRQGLKVTEEEYSPKEANYEQTFFNAKGEFLDALKTVLPMIFLDWANEIPLRYRQAVGVLIVTTIVTLSKNSFSKILMPRLLQAFEV